MIEITEKKDCCGCEACVQICPKKSLSVKADNEGFIYPECDRAICVECGLCEKVCPIQHSGTTRSPLHTYAVKNKDKNVVRESSSGGVFYQIATSVIECGGVVFGGRFNDSWEVIHDYSDTLAGIKNFMTSKYVQSKIGQSYKMAREFLNQGRTVLFTGTPCQIAGLHSFLRRTYEKLITMDFLCHGVPSPKVWRMYLEEQISKHNSARRADAGKSIVLSHSLNSISSLEDIKFREKGIGWEKYRFVLLFSEPFGEEKKSFVLSSLFSENPYMMGFLNDLYLRPSCHQCRFKRFQSQSDITVGDFWAISRVRPDFYDPMGVSMVFINSKKAESLVQYENFEMTETSFADTLSNKGLKENVSMHKNRMKFFAHLDDTTDLEKLILRSITPSLWERALKKLKRRMAYLKGR